MIGDGGSLLVVVEEAFGQREGGAELDDLAKLLAVDLRLRSSAGYAERTCASLYVNDDCPGSKDLAGNGGGIATEHEPSYQVHASLSERREREKRLEGYVEVVLADDALLIGGAKNQRVPAGLRQLIHRNQQQERGSGGRC